MPQGESGERDGLTLRDIWQAVWRQKWIVVAVVCVGAGAAYANAARQPRQYTAGAELMYVQPVDPASPLDSSLTTAGQALTIENTLSVALTPMIAAPAQRILGNVPAGDYAVTAAAEGANTTTSTTASYVGNLIGVTATGPDPTGAARVANAYATAIVTWRKTVQVNRVESALRAVHIQLRSYRSAASRRTAGYALLLQNLAQLNLLKPTTTADLEVIAPATPEASPIAPNPRRSGMKGLGVGLLAGVVLGLIVDQATTKVRTQREVGDVLGLPVIGHIPRLLRQSDGRPVAFTRPDGQVAEALRLLRSNLDYANGDEVSSVLVAGPLSGDGGSLLACNLAVTMAMAGKRVVVVDGDLRHPTMHEYFGLDNDVGLSTVVAGTAEIAQALRPVSLPLVGQAGGDGNGSAPDAAMLADRRLVVLTAGPRVASPGEVVASSRFGAVIRALQSTNVDLVIVAAPPLLECGDAAAMASRVEGLVVVVNLPSAHRSTLEQTRALLAALPCRKIGAVATGVKAGRL